MTSPLQLRKNTLQARNQLTQAEISSKSLLILNNLLDLDVIKDCHSIFAYVSFRSEVATLTLVDTLIALGKKVTVPITRVEEKRLDAIQITNRAKELEPGYCNIPEPKESICQTQLIAPKDIEVIILPGSVFDERGGRFGYGGGYYDRFLSAVPTAKRIGLAFDLQIVKEAPLHDHDEILDLVVTETRVLNGTR